MIPKVWFTIPSARPVPVAWRCLVRWLERGYGVAVWRDKMEEEFLALVKASGFPVIVLSGKYPGYGSAFNLLSAHVFKHCPEATFCVGGGDDTRPSEEWHPAHISIQLEAHFKGTFGVCQPTGDRWADAMGPIIDRIAGSPWVGREWAMRAHGGTGAMCHLFKHQFVDECLKWAAEREGVYLMRQDIGHFHENYTRTPSDGVSHASVPPHMLPWVTKEHWNESKALFQRFKAEYDAKWRPLPADVTVR